MIELELAKIFENILAAVLAAAFIWAFKSIVTLKIEHTNSANITLNGSALYNHIYIYKQ